MNIRIKAVWLTLLASLLVMPSWAANMDSKSQELANASVDAMGGREAYDNTRYLSWLFFGRRFHVWDKYTGDIRIEYDDGNVVLMNVNTKQGRVWENGEEITDEETLAEKLDWGYKVWINDSYWLVMPYKLHDPGVNLAYTRADQTQDGRDAHVLTMTFNDVGVTPENKYEVYLDKESALVTQFAFFPKAEMDEPQFVLPWKNWTHFGEIMLSDDRGQYSMAPVQTYQEIAPEVLTQPSATNLAGALL